jgi:hypothetical protein
LIWSDTLLKIAKRFLSAVVILSSSTTAGEFIRAGARERTNQGFNGLSNGCHDSFRARQPFLSTEGIAVR